MLKDVLRRAFNDICQGYSVGSIFGKQIFIRHISYVHQIGYEELERQFFERAKNGGLSTEKERIEFLIKEGRWSEKKEKEIKSQKEYIDSMVMGKRHAKLPSQVAEINKQIDEQTKVYNKQLREKYELIGMTCESYASRIVEEQSILEQFFFDKNFENPLYSKEAMDQLSEAEIANVSNAYNTIMTPCRDDNIKRLSIQDFFQSFYYISGDDFSTFFGKPICNLTLFQLRLANYAKYYKSIFENVDMKNAPKELYDSPDELVDWATSVTNAKKEIEKNSNSSISAVGNMKASDRKQLGIPEDTIDLSKEASKNGGSLNKEQLMRLFGK